MEIPEGVGGRKYPTKMANPERWVGGGAVLSEIPSVVGVWIFPGTTHCRVMLAFLPRFTFHISDDNLKVIPT